MAGPGGFWTKDAFGANVFVPAKHDVDLVIDGIHHQATKQGKYAYYTDYSGKTSTQVIVNAQTGEKIGTTKSHLAAGVTLEKLASETKGGPQGLDKYIAKSYKTDAVAKQVKLQAAYGKTIEKPIVITSTGQVVKKPPLTAEQKAAKAEAAATKQAAKATQDATATKPTTQAWQAKSVNITTLAGKKETVEGLVKDNLAVTKNPKTGEHHLTDVATGKTLSKHASQEDAVKAADAHQAAQVKSSAQAGSLSEHFGKEFSGHVYKPPAGYEAWGPGQKTVSSGEKAMMKDYGAAADSLQYLHVTALKGYQDGEYTPINHALWNGQKPSGVHETYVKALDEVMAVSATKRNLIAVRSEGTGHPLHALASQLKVGDVYHAKGYDSAMIDTGNTWQGGGVRVIYRVPKGTPSMYVPACTKHNMGEKELLFDRNQSWKVVGKHTHKGQVTIEVEYLGKVTTQ